MDEQNSPPTEQSGLTVELMDRLERGKSVQPRARVTNTATYVLGGLALLVGVFSLGAWIGRESAPASTTTATGRGGVTGASGALTSGATGAAPGAGGAGGAGGTIGTVKLIDGPNVYISTAQGTVIKVTTNAQSQINVSKVGTPADLTVGETIVVQGETAADGTIAATVIRSGATGAGALGGGRPNAAGATGATGASGGR